MLHTTEFACNSIHKWYIEEGLGLEQLVDMSPTSYSCHLLICCTRYVAIEWNPKYAAIHMHTSTAVELVQ